MAVRVTVEKALEIIEDAIWEMDPPKRNQASGAILTIYRVLDLKRKDTKDVV